MTATKEKQIELSPIHDFSGKSLQEGLFEWLEKHVNVQVACRKAKEEGTTLDIQSLINNY